MSAAPKLSRLYWEDFEPERSFPLGSVTVSREEILEFARTWDPQGFHLDADAAAAIGLDDVIASGIHTLCICSRALVTGLLGQTDNLPGPEAERIRWPNPVRPGDTVAISYRPISRRRTRSRPDRGLVVGSLEAVNQDGELVLEMTMKSFVKLRG